jgi:hypothetical protein
MVRKEGHAGGSYKGEVPGHGSSAARHASGNIAVTSSLLLVYWGPVVREGGGSRSTRWEEGGNLGLDICLLGLDLCVLGQEDLEFLLLLVVDIGVDP